MKKGTDLLDYSSAIEHEVFPEGRGVVVFSLQHSFAFVPNLEAWELAMTLLGVEFSKHFFMNVMVRLLPISPFFVFCFVFSMCVHFNCIRHTHPQRRYSAHSPIKLVFIFYP